MNEDSQGSRNIDLEILLDGGHRQLLTLPEDSPLLAELFATLAGGDDAARFLQLPVHDGRAACSFHSSQLVGVLSRPPVILDLAGHEQPEPPAPQPEARPARAERPPWLAIDDFLSPPEVRRLLAWTLQHHEHFKPGTVGGERNEHRENQVILDFGYSAFANLLRSRLLAWYPLLCRELGIPLFPLKDVESQLTAANDGQYYRLHDDASGDSVAGRQITCVYYFHREPKAFEGGELRLYDTEIGPDRQRRPARTSQTVEPIANRMVVFPSNAFHEVRTVRCPSRDFADSRFAVTHWLHRRQPGDQDVRFGWGQRRFDVVPSADG